MNKEKLPGILLIVLAFVQIPFTVIGVILIIGVMEQGPSYFQVLYDAPPLSQVLIENLPDGLEARRSPQSKSKPAPLTGQALDLPTPEAIEPAEALPPRVTPPEQSTRRIADLPVYHTESSLGVVLLGMEGLAVDYLSVPRSRSRHAQDLGPLRIKFGRVTGPRVLVLVSQPGLSWQFEGELPPLLSGVLVAVPDAAGEETLAGLPDSVPAARLDLRRSGLRFLLSALPDCKTGIYPPRAFKCADLVRDKSTGQYRTTFQIVEDRVGLLLGKPIASVSAAFANDKDRVVLIPEEIVDDAVRERARSYLDRYAKVLEAEKLRKQTLKEYGLRWIGDRRSRVLDEVARHEPYAPRQIVEAHPQVLIVSATGGVAEVRSRRAKAEQVKNYEEFFEQKAARVGTIVVEVRAREPTVIIATASEAVDWHFEFARDANVLAVHVEGYRAPTVSGVPQEIPLVVRSFEYGDRNAAPRVRVLTDKDRDNSETRAIRASLERFQQMYRGSALTIYEKTRLDRVILTDRTKNGDGG